MARPLRIEMAGGLVHGMSRGSERRAIVCHDADRQRRLEWLQRTVRTPSAWGRTATWPWPLPRWNPGAKLHRILAELEERFAIDY